LRPEQGGDPLVPDEVNRGQYAIKIPKWQEGARQAKAKLEQLMTAAA
jgi:hypothetical protein